MYIADATENPIGTIVNPVSFGNSPTELGKLIGFGITSMLTVGVLVALLYMMWGTYNWITSGGDKDRLQKAQGKIRNAIIGIFIMVLLLAVFAALMQTVLGGRIIQWTDKGLQFNIPTLQKDNRDDPRRPGGF